MTDNKTALKLSDYVLILGILLAFAANSILNRLALKTSSLVDQITIDPASFTAIRLVSGALCLALFLYFSGKPLSRPQALHWRGAVFLFTYAIAFSYAYISLDAAMGALILFGVVQVCILCVAIIRGKKLNILEWLGCLVAVIGLLVLTLPQILSTKNSGPDIAQINNSLPIILMVLAGIAWGLFTVNGAGSKDSLLDTATCFILSVPMIVLAVFIVIAKQSVVLSVYGAFLAMVSGVFASGMGYALWYQVLPKLAPSQAASAQLLVPIIAALGGFVFLDEVLNFNFIIASTLTLGGVLLVIKAAK